MTPSDNILKSYAFAHGLKLPDEVPMKQCPECKGSGMIYLSECCQSEPYSNGDASSSDYGICPECGEHCVYEENECDTCNGSGKVPMTEEDLERQDHEAFLNKVDDFRGD
jgi:DnaJ-class molecular chaperone